MGVFEVFGNTLKLLIAPTVAALGVLLAIIGVSNRFSGLSDLQLYALAISVWSLIILCLLVFRAWQLSNLPGNARILEGEEELYEYLYKNKDSVVQSAKTHLIITGSRSRDQGYLDAIFNKVCSGKVRHLRVLFEREGRISGPFRTHLESVVKYAASLPKVDGEPRVSVVMVPAEADFSERFICASESKAIVIVQSPNRLDGYDAAVLIRDKKFVRRMITQLQNVKTLSGCDTIENIEQTKSLEGQK